MIERYLPIIRRFLAWWWRELLTMLPDKSRRFFSLEQKTIQVKLTADGAQFDLLEHKQTTALGVFPYTEDGYAAYQTVLTNRPDLKQVSNTLVLTSEQCLSRQITLPAQAANNIAAVAGYEMDRLTPFHVDQVAYDVINQKPSSDTDSILATLIVIPKDALMALLDRLNAFSVSPQKVSCAVATSDITDRQVNLLPDALRPAVDRKVQAISVGLILLVCVQLFIILAAPSWQSSKQINALKQQISALDDKAHAVSKTRQEISAYTSLVNQLIEKPNYKRPVIDIINEATNRMPNTSWLNQVRLSGGKLQVSGFSTQATGIIQALDDSPLFANTRFASPLANSKRAQQAFKITTDIVEAD